MLQQYVSEVQKYVQDVQLITKTNPRQVYSNASTDADTDADTNADHADVDHTGAYADNIRAGQYNHAGVVYWHDNNSCCSDWSLKDEGGLSVWKVWVSIHL